MFRRKGSEGSEPVGGMRQADQENPHRKDPMNVRGALCVVVSLLLFCSRSFCARADELSLGNRFGISVEIAALSGMYAVYYSGQLWLGRGFVSVLAKNRWYRSAEVKFPSYGGYDQRAEILILEEAKRDSGNDRLGPYESVSLRWKVPTISDSVI